MYPGANQKIMDYKYFTPITKKQRALLKVFSLANWLFNKLKFNIEITSVAANDKMISLEQRINMFHLANEVLVWEVEGDFVEIGCHTGNSAMQIQSILERCSSEKKFHVYDKFNVVPNSFHGIREIFTRNFIKAGLQLPYIHEGLFNDTIPSQLPGKISFVHIDAGQGEDQVEFKNLMLHLLQSLYSRMPKSAIGLLMDYYDPERTVEGSNPNPGVKEACDLFFADKPEKVFVLYGKNFSHGYFRKA